MVYIISSILRKAFEKKEQILREKDLEGLFKHLMLTPFDYSQENMKSEVTEKFMEKIHFQHGGE